MANKKTLRSIKKHIGDRVHVEKAHHLGEALSYCSKQDTRVQGPWEFGLKPAHTGNLVTKDYVKMTEAELVELPLSTYINAKRAIEFHTKAQRDFYTGPRTALWI